MDTDPTTEQLCQALCSDVQLHAHLSNAAGTEYRSVGIFRSRFFTLSEPFWVCDLGTRKKIDFFIAWPPFRWFLAFLPHAEWELNKNTSLTPYTNGFFASIPKSPTQMGSLSVYNSVTKSHAWAPLIFCTEYMVI